MERESRFGLTVWRSQSLVAQLLWAMQCIMVDVQGQAKPVKTNHHMSWSAEKSKQPGSLALSRTGSQ